MKILKEAGIIGVHEVGTKNFYYLDSTSASLSLVTEFWSEAVELMKCCPIQEKGDI